MAKQSALRARTGILDHVSLHCWVNEFAHDNGAAVWVTRRAEYINTRRALIIRAWRQISRQRERFCAVRVRRQQPLGACAIGRAVDFRSGASVARPSWFAALAPPAAFRRGPFSAKRGRCRRRRRMGCGPPPPTVFDLHDRHSQPQAEPALRAATHPALSGHDRDEPGHRLFPSKPGKGSRRAIGGVYTPKVLCGQSVLDGWHSRPGAPWSDQRLDGVECTPASFPFWLWGVPGARSLAAAIEPRLRPVFPASRRRQCGTVYFRQSPSASPSSLTPSATDEDSTP